MMAHTTTSSTPPTIHVAIEFISFEASDPLGQVIIVVFIPANQQVDHRRQQRDTHNSAKAKARTREKEGLRVQDLRLRL